MKRSLTLLLTIASILFGVRRASAGATEDLWKALKGAEYPAALAAISAGADVNNLDPAFGTPLNFAACWADSAVVRALLDAKADVLVSAKANKYTPLMNAAAWGNTAAVKMLLAAGSDLKAVNIVGQTVLATAVYGAKLEIVKLIVGAGADPKEAYKVATLDMNLLKSLVGVHSPKEKLAYIKTVSGSLAVLI
jgi:ankyrin repeat protein